MKLIFVDIETTGLSPERDRITELALLFSDGREITHRKVFLFNPECRIPPMITNLTGISNEMVRYAPLFQAHAKEIVELTEDATLVGHNVRFDYSFLAAEFKRLGFKFHRDHACTITLARKHFPGFPSYGLKKVCENIGVGTSALFARAHRAEADAELCYHVFRKCYEASGAPALPDFFKGEARPRHVPALMQRSDIDAIPKSCGVYYFHDEHGALLYVGKSVNLKDRVVSHFQADLRDEKERRLKERTAKITWQLAPTELAALLLEAEEIKRLKPLYNRALRENRQNFAIHALVSSPGEPIKLYLQPHQASVGPDGLAHGPLDGDPPLRLFKTRTAADRYLSELTAEHGLCENLCFRGGRLAAERARELRACFGRQIERCAGVCDGSLAVEAYNAKVRELVAGLASTDPENYVLCEKIKGKDEWVVVWIERGTYRGWGVHSGRLTSRNASHSVRSVQLRPENPDIYRIIRTYRLGGSKVRIYPLADAEQTSLYQLA